jgi:hypothetical protein
VVEELLLGFGVGGERRGEVIMTIRLPRHSESSVGDEVAQGPVAVKARDRVPAPSAASRAAARR